MVHVLDLSGRSVGFVAPFLGLRVSFFVLCCCCTLQPTMAASSTDVDAAEDVNDFLLRIRELGEKRDKEDEERTKKLEEEILQGRKERQARRAGTPVAFVYLSLRTVRVLLRSSTLPKIQYPKLTLSFPSFQSVRGPFPLQKTPRCLILPA